MPDNKTDNILIYFPQQLGQEMRVKVVLSPHYKSLTQFVTLAVEEKLKREFNIGARYEIKNDQPEENKETQPGQFKKVP